MKLWQRILLLYFRHIDIGRSLLGFLSLICFQSLFDLQVYVLKTRYVPLQYGVPSLGLM